MRVFLARGTLLGWLRQCDFIPHTSDIDFGAFHSDLTPEWLDLMENLTDPFFKHRFGTANETFEVTFLFGKQRIDLFFAKPLPGPSHGIFFRGVEVRDNRILVFRYPLPFPFSLC